MTWLQLGPLDFVKVGFRLQNTRQCDIISPPSNDLSEHRRVDQILQLPGLYRQTRTGKTHFPADKSCLKSDYFLQS